VTDPTRLDAHARRAILARSVVRSLAIIVGVLAVYFVVPLGNGQQGGWVLVAAGLVTLVGFGSLFAYQLRSIRRAPYPMVRAVEGLVSIAVTFLVVTAAVHFALSSQDAQAYTEQLSRLDSFYFTVTMVTTVGFGDITPVTAVARSFTTAQMVLSVVLLTGVVRVLTYVAKAERNRRSAASG
jgi:hypothetical protein